MLYRCHEQSKTERTIWRVFCACLARNRRTRRLIAAALATAEVLRSKAKARRNSIEFCIANPDRIEDVSSR
jgi:hypothetical protein